MTALPDSSRPSASDGLPGSWIDQLTVPEVLAKPLAQYAEPSKAFLDSLAAAPGSTRGYPDVHVALAAHEVVDGAYRSAAVGGETQLLSLSPGALR